METVRWTDRYFRIRERRIKDPKAYYEYLKKGYGTEHPERISGFSGLMFGGGETFVSKMLLARMKSQRFRTFVYQSLRRFEKEDYGDITESDKDLNGESRWLGNGDGVTGRYGYYGQIDYESTPRCFEIIRIRIWKGNTWITCDTEPDWFMLCGEEDPAAVEEAEAKAEAVRKKEGPDFLLEYREHPECYLPLTCRQYQFRPDNEPEPRSFYWNAGLLEGNRPYFAEFRGRNLYVIVSDLGGMNNREAVMHLMEILSAKGLLSEEHSRFDLKYPYFSKRTEADGCEFTCIHFWPDMKKLNMLFRWTGNLYTRADLNALNAQLDRRDPEYITGPSLER